MLQAAAVARKKDVRWRDAGDDADDVYAMFLVGGVVVNFLASSTLFLSVQD